MSTPAKRSNDSEEYAESEEKKTKVRKITTAMDFFASSRARFSINKSKPHRNKINKKKKAKTNDATVRSRDPEFFFDVNHWKIIEIKELRNLILHILTEEDRCPQWLYIENMQNIKKVVFLMIPGLDPSLFGITANDAVKAERPLDWEILQEKGLFGDPDLNLLEFLPIFPQIFSHGCITRAPGDAKKIYNPMGCLFNCFLSDAQKESIIPKKNPDDIHERIHLCLLTPEEMVHNNYPLPTCMEKDHVLPDGWVEVPMSSTAIWTNVNELSRKKFRVLSVDCEMCLSNALYVLTRVSIVDIDCNIVYDELVMPEEPITDYLTSYSGITEERLKGVTTTIKDVQKRLLELVECDTVLVGHSLECDLKALKFAHPYVIDTSILYTNPGGVFNKSSLKMLAYQWLNRSIQVGGIIAGHDSVEDAKATMDLVKLKLNDGLDFDKSYESIIQRLERYNKTSAFIDYSGKVQLLGADLEDLPEHIEDRLTTLKRFNERIANIYSKLPSFTAFIVSSCSGDTREWKRLSKKKLNDGINWTVQDQEIYEEQLLKGKLGLTFFRIKSDTKT
ncbi:3640_t:CDS:10 [Funneliformis geosporum]|uniref:7494_t:CDS:1 n=1 Tax=Funneliformis geosporum TaxID=1117311 RepID=A0A9W4SEX3_9GLOM|nr:7494_t:CDS:10 [Funneliformis geosporum]CAI2177367.1 3640_t:CDS:10 [Funneliformis geosporum]